MKKNSKNTKCLFWKFCSLHDLDFWIC